MNILVGKARKFLLSEEGPTAVEYAVMLALIVVVCLSVITAIGSKSSATFNKVTTSMGGS